MPKKIVIKADLVCSKCKTTVMSTVAKLAGIKSMAIDPEKCTLTVIGDVDPVLVVCELRKACKAAKIVSVTDEKKKEKPKHKEKPCEKPCGIMPCEIPCTDSCYYAPCKPGCHYYSPYKPGCYYYEETSPGECSIQ